MRTYSLYDVFVRNSNVSSDSIALIENDEKTTFQDIYQDVANVSVILKDKGISKGDCVALLSMNNSCFFILLGALAKLGAIIVPLNWRLSNGELRYMLADCAAKLLFTDENHAQTATDITNESDVKCLGVEELMARVKEQRSKTLPIDTNANVVDSETPLCIIYTAAVEGYPKGAVLSHGNLIAANMQVITSMGLSDEDINLNMLPLFHITGLNLALAVMQVGGRNVIIEKFNEKQVLELTASENVTMWGSFPPILSRTLEEFEKNEYDISSLKYVVGLDGPETITSFEEKTKAKFWILYGQSETTGFVTFGEASKKIGSAGKQGCLTTFSLVDEEDKPVETGDIGEIVVRGPLVFQGYWKKENINKKTFRNGWHHTGDLGQMDQQGFLHYKGRKPEKELIKPGGENVYPAEVEAAILEHQDVEAVCVIGVPDEKFGEAIKAVCVLNNEVSLETKDLIEFVASRIARYKKPKYIEFVDELPIKNGSIDREKIKELWGSAC